MTYFGTSQRIEQHKWQFTGGDLSGRLGTLLDLLASLDIVESPLVDQDVVTNNQ